MTTLHTLASGSSGNAFLFSHDGTHVLVDAGISCRRIRCSLQALDLDLADLCGIFITHTHTDHICGLQTLLKNCSAPVWASRSAAAVLEGRFWGLAGRLNPLEMGQPEAVGSFTVTPVATSHDAPGSCGFRLDSPGGSAAVLTDTGYITQEAAALLPGVDAAILEANHDVESLLSGPYPDSLKSRILGPRGHLSNEDSARFAVALAQAGARDIILAHLSAENNTPAMALRAVETALRASGLSPAVEVAPRDRLGPLHVLQGRTLCRK